MLIPEFELSRRDSVLGSLIKAHDVHWPGQPTEDPIWGLLRIVMAQQISTRVACRMAEHLKNTYPHLAQPTSKGMPPLACLRSLGLSGRRAKCCLEVIAKSDEIR